MKRKKKMELIKATSLETSPNVKETLTWKIAQLAEDDKNVSNGLADYIYLGVSNLENQLAQLKELEADIKERKTALNEQIKAIKNDGATFLLENGIERLDGVLASSVTVTKGKAESSKTKFKLLVSKKESEEYLVDAGLAVYESVEVPATDDTLRINKRKIALSEVVEDEGD